MLRLYHRLRDIHPALPQYLLAAALMAVCGGIFENTYNNYLYAEFRISPDARGRLELIREFPGLMNVFLMGALAFLAETRVAALAAFITAVGLIGFAVRGDHWGLMLAFTLLWGAGSHLLMPIGNSLTMSFGGETKRGRRLGQVGAVSTIGSIIGAAIVWAFFRMGRASAGGEARVAELAKWQFNATFMLAALACIGAGILYLRMRNVGQQTSRTPFVLRRKYWLYYVLNVLFGARKQVFITFGRWVLVTVFFQTPTAFAQIWIVASAIGIWFNPLLGRMVDRLGERTVLIIDSFVMMLVCFIYGGAEHLGLSRAAATYLVMGCFMLDQLFFATGMARETYLAKIARSKDDLTATLSMGVTINHLIAATIPTLGGWAWHRYGYEYVFAGAGVVAVMLLVFSAMIPRRSPAAT